MARGTTGIDVRHRRTCPAAHNPEGRCRCRPSYQAHVWSARERKRIRKTFSTLAEAKAWRAEALVALRRGTMRAPTAATLRQVWEAWLAGAQEGSIRNRSGDAYKPSALRGYEASMRLRVLPDLGGARLSEITRVSVQDLADRMLAAGHDASTIRNTLIPLRAIYRRALARGEVAVNPVAGVELPAVRGRRDRIASPPEAAALIAAVPEDDRAVWATAFYAGLRLGELLALRDEDVDLEGGVLRVERSWDRREGVIEPKSRAGRRLVPIVAALRSQLAARKLRRRRGGEFLFGDGRRPLQPRSSGREGREGLEAERASANRPARSAAYVRLDLDRRRRERQSALQLPGPQLDPDHARPLRALDAGERGRGRRTCGCVPRACFGPEELSTLAQVGLRRAPLAAFGAACRRGLECATIVRQCATVQSGFERSKAEATAKRARARFRSIMRHLARSTGGGGEIRTHGGLPLSGFQDRPVRPLRHPAWEGDRSSHERIGWRRSRALPGRSLEAMARGICDGGGSRGNHGFTRAHSPCANPGRGNSAG